MADKEKVKEYFVKAAVSFDSLYSEEKTSKFMRYINHKFRRDIYERFILTINHLEKNNPKSVLDVGCGSGRYEVAMGQLKIDKITGIDVSQRMIELAQSNIVSNPDLKSNTNFICCDFDDYQAEKPSDVVVAMGFFDYIKTPIPFLKKMNKLANHSVIASFPSISFYRTPIRRIRYFLKNCPVYFYNKRRLEYFAKEAGFSKLEIIKIKGAGMDYFVAFYK